MDHGFKQINARFDQIDTRMDKQLHQFNVRMDKQLDQINTRMDRESHLVHTRFDTLQQGLIVVGGVQKRSINQMAMPSRRFQPDTEEFKNLVNVYESDFGVCRIALSRWVPKGTVLLLDSSRIEVPAVV